MATLTATQAEADYPVFKATGAGIRCTAVGDYEMTANPTAADILLLCKVPAGVDIIGGEVRMEDLDTNATETLDFDVGTAADPDMLGNLGVQTGDAVVGYLPEGGILLPLAGLLKDGPIRTTAETTIQITWIAAAATFAAGHVTLCVDYRCP